jgi:hypothetical protein
MRTFAVLLFAIANVAGPWLCCCDPSRLLPALLTTVPGCHDEVIGCPHCKESKEQKPVDPKRGSAPKPCPCESQAPVEMMAVEAKNLNPFAVMLALSPAASGDAFVAPTIEVPGTATASSEWPFLTAYERLFVHHAMRC